MLNIEIITIGDEILIGQVVDTNSAWIGQQMNLIGARVSRINSIGDTAAQIEAAIMESASRVEVILVTGGLGPTKDDITKHTLARLMGVPLVRDNATYSHVEALALRLGLPFNDLNRDQALVPQGCMVMPNPIGTAPGMACRLSNGTMLFALPGVPFEMKKLVSDHVIPIIKESFELREVVHRTIITFGIAESDMAERIASWEDALPEWLHLAYLPSPRGLRLRLSAYDIEADVARAEIDNQYALLSQIIGFAILGDEPSTVESEVAAQLMARSQTLAVAESCTGGSIAARITAMEGASNYFVGGVTSYNNSVKTGVLGVSSNDLEQYGAVSRQVAEQMAVGVRDRLGADYAIATTGIAGPTGGSEQKPVGTVWMALADANGVTSQCMHFGELRTQNIERAATHALNMLRIRLCK